VKITIEFDMTTTEFPQLVTGAAKDLMLAARGLSPSYRAPVSEANLGVADDETQYSVNQTFDDIQNVTEEAADKADEIEAALTPTAAKKRGRKSAAEKAAEQAPASEETVTGEPVTEDVTPVQEIVAMTPVFTPPAGVAPPMFTPTVVPTTVTTPPPFALVVQPQAAAMPDHVDPVIDPNATTLEDLKAIMALTNEKKPGATFPVLRRAAWSDGSPKAPWLTAEQVPAELRGRLAAEMAAEVGL
jgi:hypothetical protein